MTRLVNRSELKSYMNTGTTETPVWSLIGEGFTALSENKNPKTYARRYVHENFDRTDVMGYAPSIPFTADVYEDDPVMNKIREIYDSEAVGTDAQVEILSVREYEYETETPTVFEAIKRTYSTVCDKMGDGTDALQIGGTFYAVGEMTEGTFTSGTFTPAA